MISEVWTEIGEFLGVKGDNSAIFENEIKRHVGRINGIPEGDEFYNNLSKDAVHGDILKMFSKMLDYKGVTSQTFVSIEFLVRRIHQHISEPATAITEQDWVGGTYSISREFERMSKRLVFWGLFRKRQKASFFDATRALKSLVDDEKSEAKHLWMIFYHLGLNFGEEQDGAMNLDNFNVDDDEV